MNISYISKLPFVRASASADECFLKYLFLLIICMCVHGSVCTGVHRCQKRASDPLELQLQVFVSYGIGCRDCEGAASSLHH